MNKLRLLAPLVVAVAMLLASGHGTGQQSFALSNDGPTVAEQIERLEKEVGLQAAPTGSLLDRISALEQKVFSSVSEGPLLIRLKRVRTAIEVTGASDGASPAGAGDSQDKSTTRTTEVRQSKTHDQAASKPEPAGSPEKAATGNTVQQHVLRLATTLPPQDVLPPRFYRIEPPSSSGAPAGDYIASVMKATKNKVLRFRTMPVPVYITRYKDKRYTRACIQGFENWETRSGGAVRFVQVGRPELARIRVIWSRLGLNTDGSNCALGAHTVTKWKKNSSGKMALMAVGAIPLPLYIPRLGKKYKVPPQVIEVNVDLIDSKIEDIRFIVLKNIVTHELGHALGLLGHSSNRADMMYSVTDENSRLSRRDLNTIRRLYQMKVDIPL